MSRWILTSFLVFAFSVGQPSCKGNGGGDDTSTDDPVDTSPGDAADVTGEDPVTEPTMDVNGFLEDVDGIDVLWLWGTRDEMGYAEGAILCGRIRDMFRDYVLDYVVLLPRTSWSRATTSSPRPEAAAT
jgi:hypothetical protein